MADLSIHVKTLFKINTKRLAMANPLVPKDLSYSKFIILSMPRTGSTLLHTFLNYHSHVHSLGELSNEAIGPIRWHPYPKSIEAVGLKVFYDSPKTKSVRDLFSQLEIPDDAKIIWLRRRNRLRQWLSLKISEQTGSWSTVRSEPQIHSLELTPEEFLSFLKKAEDLDHQVLGQVSGKEHVSLFYEDVVNNTQFEMEKIWKLLGVTSVRPVSLLKQQHPQSVKELLANHRDFSQLKDPQIEEWLVD
jgi:LPS sulfotransferase NodH